MEKKKISVCTVPNGYTLSFNGSEYMYYTMAALLEGFMYHVGLEELNAIDAESMRDFLTASIVWKDNAEAVKALVVSKKENESLRSQIKNLKIQVKRLSDKLKDGEVEED